MKNRLIIIRIIVLFQFLLLVSLNSILAQTDTQSLDNKSKRAIVERISSLLTERYVFPDIAKQCSNHIKAKLESKEFEEITNAESFASILTTELQSISKDKHMRVRVRRPEQIHQEEEDANRAMYRRSRRDLEENYGFKKVEILDGNVGYIDMRYFAQTTDESKTAAVSAMKFLSNTDAVIFDMRKNGGGNPDMIRFICSYFFDKPTHLNSLYWRQGDVTNEFWTTAEVDGIQRPDVPMFVLTSNRTFSGAEEFSYNMQTQKRATLIGEVTGGGANPGGTMPINESFFIFIPTGRAINPITGTNWEGVGVKPEIEIESEKAFDLASEKAKLAAEEYRKTNEDRTVKLLDEAQTNLDKAEKMFEQGQNDSAEKLVFKGLEAGIKSGITDEPTINMMGYEYLGKEKNLMAISIFKFNVETFPESSNVYDSLGEAYMKNNQFDLAIINYTKSVDLDPENQNAKEMIKRMKEKSQ